MVTQIKHMLPKLKVPKTRTSRALVSLRTTRDELYYANAKTKGNTRPLVEEDRLKEWEYWALIKNEFPYSAAFKTHHLLIPKRVVKEKDLTDEEQAEMRTVLEEMAELYDCVLMNFTRQQSIRHHFHLHLLEYKDKRKEIKI